MGLCNKKLAFLLLGLQVMWAAAQPAGHHYMITFKDKSNSIYATDRPSEFLSPRSIERRIRQNIPIGQNDLPITTLYRDSVLKVNGVRFTTQSKWFNTVIVNVADTSVLAKMRLYDFIRSVQKLPGSGEKKALFNNNKLEFDIRDAKEEEALTYGSGYNQIAMLNGTYLHRNGYTGEGMLIAVIDAGFTRVRDLPALKHLWRGNKVLATYDFVEHHADVFDHSHHGTYVLSTMAAKDYGVMTGTAPDAEYLLLRSEDGATEYLLEEFFWVEAAEFADSAGADVLNTSLGYTTFDDADQDHVYEDMDGNTTYITRGADIAASKGMLIVNSAGNSGNGSWYYIGAPADGDSVLTIGAVGPDRKYASFSSKGPSFDLRVKPNVSAQGFAAVFAGLEGGAFTGSGTSFASPILCGLAACLWQAHPEAASMEIFRAIETSADQYSHPDDFTGYGIPDFGLAHLKLTHPGSEDRTADKLIIVLPNPFSDKLYAYLYSASGQQADVRLFDATGREVYRQEHSLTAGQESLVNLGDLSELGVGVYVLQIEVNNETWVEKVVKQ